MTTLHVLHLESLAALRSKADAWDDLWQRSAATLPLLRAEFVAQWVEHFARPEQFFAIALESEGRLVAVLPIVRQRIGRLVRVGKLPSNEWAACGDLLLDETVPDAVCDTLTDAIRECCPSLLWLDDLALDSPRWGRMRNAFCRAGMTVAEHPCVEVGRVVIDGDWPAYKARWSRKHRQKMAHASRELAKRGEVRLVVHSESTPDQVKERMQTALALEDRGWKGAAGTSVLRTPGAAVFFLRQAEQAARWGQLELAFLECNRRPVAFAYGLTAKGVFHSTKVGYDPEFSDAAPGQLLRYGLLERFFAEPGRRALDFQGTMTEAHAAWLPETYRLGRIAVAPGPLLGRTVACLYRDVWPLVRAIRRFPLRFARRGAVPP